MGCPTWTFQLPGPAADYYPMVKDMALQKGVTLTGDARSGTVMGDTVYKGVSVHLEGHYQSSGNQISITVTDKPFLAPCGAIRDALADGISKLPPPPEVGPALPPDQTTSPPVGQDDWDAPPSPFDEPYTSPAQRAQTVEIAPDDMTFTMEEVDAWERQRRNRRRMRFGLLSLAFVGLVVVRLRRTKRGGAWL